MKKILFTTNTFSQYKRQDHCVEILKIMSKNNSNVSAALIQSPDDDVSYTDISVIRELNRNASTVIDTKRNLPFINDLFDISCKHAEDIFVYINSDILISQKFINLINNTDVEAFGVSRSEIDEIENLTQPITLIRVEPAGFDAWVIQKEWWLSHRHLFKDMLLGKPIFDVMYTMLMFLNSKNHYISNQHLIFHPMHGNGSFADDVCFDFNKKAQADHYPFIEKWWSLLCNNTFWKRNDPPRFLNFNSNENEIIEILKQQILLEYKNL